MAEKRPESLPLNAPVVEVTVLEDRARVVRQGRARLEAGLQKLQVTGVAPVLSDTTLSITPEPGRSGLAVRVVDCRVLRRLVPRSPGGEEPKSQRERLEAERARIDRALAKRDAERTLAAQQAGALACLAELALTEITEDVAQHFYDETKLLNIKLPPTIASSSTSIQEAAEIIRRLLDSEHAYWHGGNVFFDPLKFKGFGAPIGKRESR